MLHGVVVDALVLSHVVDLHDARVLQARHGARRSRYLSGPSNIDAMKRVE